MIEKSNVDLSKYTTFRVGGIAQRMIIPESEDELREIINELVYMGEHIYILSGGSNLLINDKKTFKTVIYMKSIDNKVIRLTEGRFYVGASNRIQKVITELDKIGYGGFEEFIGLPAMIGGMIYMNAGIGSENNSRFAMSDFVERVRAFDLETKDYIWLLNKDCKFSHRKSVFQTGRYIIVGCEIRLSCQDIEKSKERIAARKDYCRKNMEYGKGCFGTVFSRCSGKLVKLNALAMKFKKMNVQQGRIKANWLVNCGDGTFDEAMTIIENCERLHKMFGKMILREVQIWE